MNMPQKAKNDRNKHELTLILSHETPLTYYVRSMLVHKLTLWIKIGFIVLSRKYKTNIMDKKIEEKS